MISEEFSIGDSPVHSLDPRVKVLAAALFTVIVAVAMNFRTLAFALAATLILFSLSRLSPARVAKRLLVVNGFILFLWLLLPLTYPGRAIAHIGPVSVSAEGVAWAALITVKSNIIITALLCLVSTSSAAGLGHALQSLKVPMKLTVLFLFAYRYIFVIESEYKRMKRTLKARAFRPKTNLHTYRTYAHLVGMLLVKSWERAERVHQAMLCRGFDGKFHSLHEFSLKPGDLLFLIAASVTSGLLIIIESGIV